MRITTVGSSAHCDIRLDGHGFYIACRDCPHVSVITAAKHIARRWATEHDNDHEAAERAAELGHAHGADGGPPLASLYLGEDERLWPALGITSAVTEDNWPERERILAAYCDAFDQAAGVAAARERDRTGPDRCAVTGPHPPHGQELTACTGGRVEYAG